METAMAVNCSASMTAADKTRTFLVFPVTLVWGLAYTYAGIFSNKNNMLLLGGAFIISAMFVGFKVLKSCI